MCESNEMEPAITQLDQDLRAQGWSPVEMMEPFTGTLFTLWYQAGKPTLPVYWEFAADHMDFPPNAAESGEPAAYVHLDREFISDNMDFPPNFENGPNPLGEDY